MIDPNPLPSRQLRTTASFARWALRLLLAFWLILVGAGVVLHGFIVPRISAWGGQVERLASDALGVTVRIGDISARSEGLFPAIELNQLQLLNAQEDVTLTLPRVVLTVSARSLLRLGLEQLYIESASFAVVRKHSGEWEIAGLPSTPQASPNSEVLEWLLKQPELALRNARIEVLDERNASFRTAFTEVSAVFRHKGWRHQIRVDATPSDVAEQKIVLMGDFRQPLLPSARPVWKRWTGQWYGSATWHAIPAFQWPDSWRLSAVDGAGTSRFWLDVVNGQSISADADVALQAAAIVWKKEGPKPLNLQGLQGRLHVRAHTYGWEIAGHNFSFSLTKDLHWPSSQWSVQLSEKSGKLEKLRANLSYADLAMTAHVLSSLPASAEWTHSLERWRPKGELRNFHFTWSSSEQYQADGQLQQLSWQEQATASGIGMPGVQGLNGEFHFSDAGGRATLSMQHGSLIFPGVFEEPQLPLDQLSAQVRWSHQAGHWHIDVDKAVFANADAAGQLQAKWQTGIDESTRLPGILKISGILERADGARVFRYLPLSVPETARHYVRDTILKGQGQQVKFEVHGALQDMPFTRPDSGRFYIEAPVQDVIFNFIPPKLRTSHEKAWPALEKLSGTLVFEGSSMAVRQGATSFAGHPQLHIASVSANIPDLNQPHVTIQALGHTKLQNLLNFVARSPLAAITGHALDQAKATEEATVSFELKLPIADLQNTKVDGRLGFHSNQLQLNTEIPSLEQVQGAVHFHEKGFALEQVRAQALGGFIHLNGGMESPENGLRLQGKGLATAYHLKEAAYLPAVSEIARYASGQANYDLEIASMQGKQVTMVRSNLEGMEIRLPTPFGKTAEHALPISVSQTLFEHDLQEIRVDVHELFKLSYLRDVSKPFSAQVLGGSIAIGGKPFQDEPVAGISASIDLPNLDIDAWLDLFNLEQQGNASILETSSYLPNNLELKVKNAKFKNQHFHNLYLKAITNKKHWELLINSEEVSGNFDYYPKTGNNEKGLLFARLDHLKISQEKNEIIETKKFQNPISDLPELDIKIKDLNIAGRNLGQLNLVAKNHSTDNENEWILEKFNLKTTESSWQAHGKWRNIPNQGLNETNLKFNLKTEDAGALLGIFSMPDIIREGKGNINGEISWKGNPIQPHIPSFSGQIKLDIGKGQFLKAEPGMGKLLSVLSLQSITRRINLDFRDIFSQGFSFDFIRGDVRIQNSQAHTNNLQMKGLNAAVLMEGSANLQRETQNLTVVVVPEINAMTASLAATAINPVIGLGSFLAQMILRAPLMEAATRSFHIHGSWYEPIVEPVKNSSELHHIER